MFTYNMQKKFNSVIYKDTISMAWPAIVEAFFVSFTGLIDSLMVSSLGANAVAAVGLTTQPKFVGFSLFFATNVAISALVARRLGEKKQCEANKLFITSILFVVVAAIILSVLLVVFAGAIMDFCGSTKETYDNAVIYFKIIMGGMIFNCIQMAINAAQRGTGNTKIAMCTNVIANVINIIMNYLLIEGHWGFPALGIVGAALATVIGTVVSCIISVCSIFRKDNYINIQYIIRNKVVPSISDFIDLGKVGYSVLFEQLLMRIGFVMTALMAAKQGNDAMAVHQVGMNIIGLSFSFGDGLQSTAVALIGRSLGENKEERAKEYGHTCKVIGSTIAVVLALIYLIGARGLYSLFFKEEHIIDIGVRIMYVVIFIVIFQISQVVYMGCLRGGGDTAYTAMASTISVTFVRTITSYFFGYILNGGIVGIWIGILGDQISRYLFASTRFKQGKWTKIRI